MWFISENRKDCSACGACQNVCPKDAVEFVLEDDTFLYPKINKNKCINCKQCENVCNASVAKYHSKLFYATQTKNQEDYYKSSSGGAFKVIVKSIIDSNADKNVYVSGVVFGNSFKAVQIIKKIHSLDDVDFFSKSKYVFANTGLVFRTIKELLKDKSNVVVFCSTPCKVAGLLKYLNKEQSNLFTIDLVCKGAPSQFFFDKYKEWLEHEHNSKLSLYQFRNKEMLDNGTIYSRSAKISFSSGETIKVTRFNDPFLKMFYFKNYNNRESCNCCEYKSIYRVSDITIGDAWGIENISSFNAIKGCSLLLFNSDKGITLKSNILKQMDYVVVDEGFVLSNNSALVETTKTNGGGEYSIKTLYCDLFKGRNFSKSVDDYIVRTDKNEKI